MAKASADFRHGRIVWAYLRTRKGKREEHPAVILTPDTSIIQPEHFDPRQGGDNVVVVAGISTKYRNYPEPYVQLPFRATPAGHPVTELRKDCAAIVGWYQALFIPDDITAFSGDVPAEEMRVLNSKVFGDFVAKVGEQYMTALQLMAELREALILKEFPPKQ